MRTVGSDVVGVRENNKAKPCYFETPPNVVLLEEKNASSRFHTHKKEPLEGSF
jgi:hypothetical protein